jgi:hypothetical protein
VVQPPHEPKPRITGRRQRFGPTGATNRPGVAGDDVRSLYAFYADKPAVLPNERKDRQQLTTMHHHVARVRPQSARAGPSYRPKTPPKRALDTPLIQIDSPYASRPNSARARLESGSPSPRAKKVVSKEETVERVLGMLRARMTQRRVLLPIFREMDEDKSGAPAGTNMPPALSEANGPQSAPAWGLQRGQAARTGLRVRRPEQPEGVKRPRNRAADHQTSNAGFLDYEEFDEALRRPALPLTASSSTTTPVAATTTTPAARPAQARRRRQ